MFILSIPAPPFSKNNNIYKVRSFQYKKILEETKIKDQSGVYIISKKDIILYVGHSKNNVIRTMYRHFYLWNNKKQYRVTYLTNQKEYKVCIIFASPANCVEIEKSLVIGLQPPDNEVKFEMAKFDFCEGEKKESDGDLPF